MILVLMLNMLMGLTFTIGKAALTYVTPIFLIGVRMSLAGVLLLGYLYFFNRRSWYFNKKDIPLLIKISFFYMYLSFLLEFWGMQYLPSAKVCFLYSLSPFVTALLEWHVFAESLTVKKWVGLIIGFFGFFPVLLTETPLEKMVGSLFFFSYPELAVLGAAITAVYAWILIKELMHKKEEYTPMMINGISMLWAGVAALITSFLFEGKNAFKLTLYKTKNDWVHLSFIKTIFGDLESNFLLLAFYIILLILIANVIYFNLYTYLLKKYTATFLSFFGFTIPLFAAFFGWLFLHELLSWNLLISVFIVGFGLYIFYQDELKRVQAVQKKE